MCTTYISTSPRIPKVITFAVTTVRTPNLKIKKEPVSLDPQA